MSVERCSPAHKETDKEESDLHAVDSADESPSRTHDDCDESPKMEPKKSVGAFLNFGLLAGSADDKLGVLKFTG